jgi:hypothetical protein
LRNDDAQRLFPQRQRHYLVRNMLSHNPIPAIRGRGEDRIRGSEFTGLLLSPFRGDFFAWRYFRSL